jgi:hypothetical protein
MNRLNLIIVIQFILIAGIQFIVGTVSAQDAC